MAWGYTSKEKCQYALVSMERLEARSILIGLIFVPSIFWGISFSYFSRSGLLFEGDRFFKKTLRTAHVKRNVPRFIVLKWTTMWNLLGLFLRFRLEQFPGTSRSKASYVKVLVVSYRPPDQTTLGVRDDEGFLFRWISRIVILYQRLLLLLSLLGYL